MQEIYGRNDAYHLYYYSWLLRGDEPDMNFNGKKDDTRPYRFNDFNDEIRNAHAIPEARELYVKYHFDTKVRQTGKKVEEFKIHPEDVSVVVELQKRIRQFIADKEIAVETNPTSNLKITDVRRYADHPILQMNARGLKEGTIGMSVSINTDDQGVFSTSLEKEFTLMAVALEKEVDEYGKPRYNRKDILDWLDYVRQMAADRTFLKP